MRTESLNGDGTLRYWKETESELYHLGDGREVTVCEMGEFVPFYLAHQFDGKPANECEGKPSNNPLEDDSKAAPQLGR